MSIDVDVSVRRSRRLVWVAVILAATVITVLVLQRVTGVTGSPVDLRGQVAERMVGVLERTPPGQHHGHGAHVNQDGAAAGRTVCGVRVFGFEPAGATRVEDVRTVYGHHLCAIAEKGLAWDGAVKLVGPVVLDLSGTPPAVQVAEATAEMPFRERVRQLIPERYQDQAFEESLDPATMTELRRRYDEAAR
ncbi:hypothetical protein [Micromonospora sp. NPDC049679]|uniref:hypothetical protein n=1 Tax=Micromonospora sp. NPDC049679 TaxID=3155920 RepID=UPI0033C289FC